MARQIFTKTFEGGMNKDIDVSFLAQNQYTHAENFQLISDDSSNNFILENAEGNKQWFNIENIEELGDTFYLVGHCYVDPYLILFYTENHALKTPSNSNSNVIVRIRVDKDYFQDYDIIYTDSYGDRLDFSDTYPISAVGLYEREDIIKVYWTDGYNPVRFINILDENLSDKSVDQFSLLPPFPRDSNTPGRPEFIEYTDGNLKSSTIQYAYQFFDKYNQSTSISLVSPGIPITPTDNTFNYPEDATGAPKDENVGRGVKLSIRIPSGTLYNGVRIIALDYEEYSQLPRVRIVKEIDIEPNDYIVLGDDLTIIDTGSLINELTYEEFLLISRRNLKAQTLEVKDNRLFLGNIIEEHFDVDFDARAYRFNASETAEIYSSSDTSYSSPTSITSSNWDSVDEDHDAVCAQNDPSEEDSELFLYQSDGETFGAEGPNVKIDFITTNKIANSDDSETYTDRIIYDSDDNPNNIHNIAYNRSFKRQEIYRLGLVFFNKELIASPVKWMCDIKMPSITQKDTNYHATNPISDYKLMEPSGTSTSGKDEFIILGLKVTLKSGVSLPTGAVGWQVVMVPREENDRSIVTMGLLQTPEPDPTTTSYRHYLDMSDIDDYNDMTGYNLNSLITPELAFNKKIDVSNGDFINLVGYYQYDSADDRGDTDNMDHAVFRVITQAITNSSDSTQKAEVDENRMFRYNTDKDTSITINSVTYNNYVTEGYYTDNTNHGFGGSKFIFSTDTKLTTGTTGEGKLLVEYRRDSTSGLFGGNSYVDRQQNEYVGISDIKFAADDTSVSTYEGDVIVDWFNYMYSFTDEDAVGSTQALSIVFPVESTILSALSLCKPYYKTVDETASQFMKELAGIYEGTVGTTDYIYNQEYDLYTYNSVYSKWFGGKFYIANDDSNDNFEKYTTRILSSEKKINGESEDSMSIFKINNFIDLDGNKGDIYKIINFKNNLYFWQNTGFGIVSVNPRSLIQDNNPGLLNLGTGGILDRFDYIEDDIGSQNPFGIVKSKLGLYWIDNNQNEIFKFDGSTTSVSKLNGIQNWINDNGQIGNVKAIYDDKYNDVIFTITFSRSIIATSANNTTGKILEFDFITNLYDLSQDGTYYNAIINAKFDSDVYNPTRNVIYYSTGGRAWKFLEENPYGDETSYYYVTLYDDPTYTYTITFNEHVNSFVSFRSFKPFHYIPLNKNFLTTNDNHDLWIHNSSGTSKSSYYNTKYDSIVEVPLNPEFPYTKVFDTLKWISESKNSLDVNLFKDTLHKAEFYNDYQYTGERELYYQHDSVPTGTTYTPIQISRRERTWSMNIPRNIVDEKVSENPNIFTDVDESRLFKERMRDKYLTAKLTYENTNGYLFSLPFVSVIYRKSIR